MKEINDMDIETGGELIIKAIIEKAKDRLWALYCNCYPHMDPEKIVSFSDFIEPLEKPKEIVKAEDVLRDIKSMMDDFAPESG